MQTQLESHALQNRTIQVGFGVPTMPPDRCAARQSVPVRGLGGVPIRQWQQSFSSDRQKRGPSLDVPPRDPLGTGLTELLPAPGGNVRSRV